MISGKTWSAKFKTETGSLIPDGLRGGNPLSQKPGGKPPQNRVDAGSACRCRSRRTVIDNLSTRLPLMGAFFIFLLVISDVGTRTAQAQEPAKASGQVT